MLIRRAIVFSVALLLMLCASLPARASGEFGGSGKFVGWWELGGFYGTDDSSRGEIVLFTPLMQSATTLFFLDARGKLFEEDVQEANLALGYRQMMPSGWNLGLWAGWDVRDTEVDNTFHQISFGVEALSERFDVRVNGYVPVTDPKGSPDLAEVFLRGNNILMVGGEEVALYGIDGEIGMLLFSRNRGGGGGLKGAPAAAKRHELRGYVGGFWFDDDDAIDEVAGPKGRLEYRINDIVSSLPGSRLTIESEVSYDEVRDTKFEIGARLRIPFGTRGSDAALRTASLNAQELRMIEGLERDTDIITVQSKEESVIDNATNVAMNAVSFASNANQFANAVDKGGNRLIILQKGSQRIDVSATNGQQLQKNQTVQGGASTILMRGARTGTVAGFRAPGSRPTLFSDDVNPLTGAITMASNTHLAGVNIRGAGGQNTSVPGNNGIVADGANNVVIEQTDIRKIGDVGIQLFDNNSDVRIYHTDLSNIRDEAIEVDGTNNSDITLKHIAITDTGPGGRGIDFDFGNRNILVEDATIRRAGQIALSTDGNTNVTFRDITIAGGGDDFGILLTDLNGENRNVTIENATITDRFNGIAISSNNRNVTIRNVRIDSTTGSGILGNDNGRNFTFEDITITNAGGAGISLGSNHRNFTFRNVNIDNVAGNGIAFRDNNDNVSFENVNITDTGGAGIRFTNNNRNIAIHNVDIRDNGGAGITLSNDNSNVAFMDVKILNTGSSGINFNSRNTDISFMNVDIINPGTTGINFNSDNTATLEDVSVRNTTFSTGINFASRNRVTFRRVSVDNVGNDGINFASDNRVVISDTTISNVGDGFGDDALSFGANNTVDINNTTFDGTIGNDILEVSGAGNVINGANNPNNATVGGFVCDTNGNGFTGTLSIGNQTFVNGAGCN